MLARRSHWKIGADERLSVGCRRPLAVGTLRPYLPRTTRKVPIVLAGQILTSVIASLLGIYVASQFSAWRHERAERDLAAGRRASVRASIRTAGNSRWRHGMIDINGSSVAWLPSTPWGRALPLTGVAFASRREPQGRLRWQLPAAAVVVSCNGAEQGYELAMLPSSVKYLYRAQFGA
jgi:hypothetical protein